MCGSFSWAGASSPSPRRDTGASSDSSTTFVSISSGPGRRSSSSTVFAAAVPGTRSRSRSKCPDSYGRSATHVLHAHTPVVANRLAFGRFAFAYTSHSRHWYDRDRLSHRWGYWLERRAVRRARATIALTAPLARTMRAVVRSPSPLPISIIPVGVDTEQFQPDWGIRTGRRALGVGVVLPFKRWEWAAQALRGTGIQLRIAGPLPSPGYAAKVRAAGDSVELLGEVGETDLRRLYAESDLLLHPSGVELLSGAVLQGLASGLPVLGGPALDGVVDNGRTGWVVPDQDPTQFVRETRARVGALLADVFDAPPDGDGRAIRCARALCLAPDCRGARGGLPDRSGLGGGRGCRRDLRDRLVDGPGAVVVGAPPEPHHPVD